MINKLMDQEEEAHRNLSDKDKRILRLIWVTVLAFFMSLLGSRMGYGSKFLELVVFNKNYYCDLVLTWGMVFLVLEYIYAMTQYLDTRQPWRDGYYRRMFMQVFLTFFGPYFFMEMYDSIHVDLTGRSLTRLDARIFQIPSSIIITLGYTMFCCLESLKDAYFDLLSKSGAPFGTTASKPLLEESSPIISIKDGEKIRLQDKPIDLVWHNDGINQIYYSVEECYDNHHTLAALYEYLDKSLYRKAGRNAIVHKECISGYKPRTDKSIVLELKGGYEQQLIVSKKEVDDFLVWYEDTGDEVDNVGNSNLL